MSPLTYHCRTLWLKSTVGEFHWYSRSLKIKTPQLVLGFTVRANTWPATQFIKGKAFYTLLHPVLNKFCSVCVALQSLYSHPHASPQRHYLCCAQTHVGVWHRHLPTQATNLQHLLAKPTRFGYHQTPLAKSYFKRRGKEKSQSCNWKGGTKQIFSRSRWCKTPAPATQRKAEVSHCFPSHPLCPLRACKQKSFLLVNSGSPAPLQGSIDVGTGECVCVCFDFCPEPPQILRARFQFDTLFWGRQFVIKAFILWEGKPVLNISPGAGGGRGGREGLLFFFAFQFGALYSILGLLLSRFLLDVYPLCPPSRVSSAYAQVSHLWREPQHRALSCVHRQHHPKDILQRLWLCSTQEQPSRASGWFGSH